MIRAAGASGVNCAATGESAETKVRAPRAMKETHCKPATGAGILGAAAANMKPPEAGEEIIRPHGALSGGAS